MERHLSVPPTIEVAEKGASRVRFTVLGSAELAGPNSAELRAALVQPKRLALLTYLALASPRGFHRRDTLLALFWPESDDKRARHALRQAVHTLRRAIAPGVIVSRGDNDLGIGPSALWCDAWEFQDALDAGDTERALSLYRGDLLPGFFVPNAAPELEQWFETERGRLRSLVATAACRVADLAESRGDFIGAVRCARRAVAFSPDDEGSLRRLIALLDRAGDRAGALRVHDEFSRVLAAEFEAEPSAETAALIESVRGRHRAHEEGRPMTVTPYPLLSASPSAPTLPPFVSESHSVPRGLAPLRARLKPTQITAIGAGVLTMLAVVAIGYARTGDGRANSRRSVPIVAVGNIIERGVAPADTAGAAGTLSELLATDLARVSGLHVVSHSRLYEILGQLGKGEPTPAALSDVARRAGATELLEGVLYRDAGSPGALRLDLRRIDLGTGVVSRAYSADGTDLFSLVDTVTAQFAHTLRLPRPSRSLAGVTSTSLAARRFYEQGMRWYYQGDIKAASRFFVAALDEDSAFGMAAFYAAESGSSADRSRVIPLLARAARNASDAPERERLLIRYSWAQMSNDPSALALAESLAVRYPNEPNGQRSWGSALLWSGDFAGAIAHLRLAVSRDSLSFGRPVGTAPCPACDGMHEIVAAYIHADSIGAAETAAREWLRFQASSPFPRMALAEVLGRRGQRAEALATASIAARTAPLLVRDSWLDVRLALAVGDFDEAHRLLGIRSQDLDQGVREDALWWSIITLRYQGRLAAASSALDRFCYHPNRERGAGDVSLECSLARGSLLFDEGRYREAALLYQSLPVAKEYQRSDPAIAMLGLSARHRSWMLTLAAAAYAAAGDTAKVASLADSVESWGRLSGYGRDRRLHFHIRGLLAAARGRHADAIALFRRAIYSPTEGYTRTNLELARELVVVGRAQEAVDILRSALHGPIEGGNLYVTQTEIHEMLAKAFERAGARDSAAVHYRRVALAWRDSDARFRGRELEAARKSASRR